MAITHQTKKNTDPKHIPVFSEDDILEILSCFKPSITREMSAQLAMAEYAAQTDITERNISEGARQIIARNLELTKKFSTLIAESCIEYASLKEQIT